jgi:site-specific DNA recombinase
LAGHKREKIGTSNTGDTMTNERAAIYARYSSDLQNDRSIADQVGICQRRAEADGRKVVTTFSDRAKSGASMFERDGLRDMMTAAKAKKFDCLYVESLDRLSRDQEDMAGIFKRLSFYGVTIETLNEGKATTMHVGIRGITSALFLKDLGDKVRRGLEGRAREGKFPGSVTYGYRTVPGKPGEREIEPEQAKIVQRFFTEYAQGRSPRQIATDLTREGVPSPNGAKVWSFQTLNGGGVGDGMLGNRLYIGELVWNNSVSVKNPDTGSRTKRKSPHGTFKVSVPHLRIIDDGLWQTVQAERKRRGKRMNGTDGRGFVARHNYLLGGILKCAACGGHMRIVMRATGKYAEQRIGCATAITTSKCEHRRSYNLDRLTKAVIDGVRTQLTNRDALVEYTRNYHAAWAERDKANRTDGAAVRKRLARVQVQIDRLVEAIRDGSVPVKSLVDQLKPLEAERVGLEERLRLVEQQGNVVSLHPKAVDAFAANVDKLCVALEAGTTEPGIRAAFQNVIDSVVVHPTARRMPYEFTPYARLGALAGVDLFPGKRTPEEILQSEGVANFATDNRDTARLPSQKNQIIDLGRWKAA